MHAQTAKFVARIAECLPDMSGDVMQGWIENPGGLKKVLGMALCPPEVASELPIWKTIKLGTGQKSARDFRKALKASGNRIGEWADDLLGRPEFANSVSKEEVEVDLVVLTTAQLTGKNGGTTAEVFAGAERLGLQKCSAEVGPQLRLQYTDQPLNEWLLIGMEPLRSSGGLLGVFDVVRLGGGLWLDGSCGSPGLVWDAGYRWVFVRPRKCQK